MMFFGGWGRGCGWSKYLILGKKGTNSQRLSSMERAKVTMVMANIMIVLFIHDLQ
jgi:hypothetical protein